MQELESLYQSLVVALNDPNNADKVLTVASILGAFLIWKILGKTGSAIHSKWSEWRKPSDFYLALEREIQEASYYDETERYVSTKNFRVYPTRYTVTSSYTNPNTKEDLTHLFSKRELKKVMKCACTSQERIRGENVKVRREYYTALHQSSTA